MTSLNRAHPPESLQYGRSQRSRDVGRGGTQAAPDRDGAYPDAQLAQGQADGAEPTLEPLRTLLKARGWNLHLKKRHNKPSVYAARKVGQPTQSCYLAVCLAAARTLPNAGEE
ncbi:MAG TPA: hypothetical protein VH593_16270 [Ktedonobacteraceae bacterium]